MRRNKNFNVSVCVNQLKEHNQVQLRSGSNRDQTLDNDDLDD